MKYIVEPIVCDYGIYQCNKLKKELVLILNNRENALLIAEILNTDLNHKQYKRENANE